MRTSWIALLALALGGAEGVAQTRVGDFLHVPATDAMSDRDLSYVSTVALGGMEADRDARLVWRCSGSTIELVLQAEELRDFSGAIPIRWRFDRTPASDRELWHASSLEPMASAPEATIYPFSEIATVSSTVLIRADDQSGRSYDYRFSLSGLNNALNRLGCTRHLEVLGMRRTVALFEQAKLSGGATDGEISLLVLVEEFPFVGHRTQRMYLPSLETCWRTHWRVEEVVFFRVEREARAGGFARSQGCTP